MLEGYDEHSRDINSLYVSYDEQLKEITDDKVVGGVIDGVKDIYFMPESASLIRVDSNTTRNFSVQLYVEVPENTSGAKEMQIDGAIVYGKEIAIGTSDGTTVGTYDNRLYRQNIVDGVEREVVVDKINGKYQLEPGVVYKTSIPISALSDFNNLIFQEDLSDEIQTEEAEVAGRNTRRIFVEATEAVVNEEAGTSTTASGYDTISVVRVQLFDLD